MAITNGTLTGTVISGGGTGITTIANTSLSLYNNGYDVANDTVYGVPAYEWHRLSSMEQRYYAERWSERLRADQDRRYREATHNVYSQAPEQSKTPKSSFMDNKLLLLEN